MQLKVYLTERDAIVAGVDAGYHSVNVEASALTQAQREWLARQTKSNSDGMVYIQGPTHPTAESLVAWIVATMEAEAAEAAEKKARISAATDAWMQAEDASLVRSGNQGYGYTILRHTAGHFYEIDEKDPRVVGRMPRLEELGRQLAAERDAERKADAARRESERLAREEAVRQDEQRLRDWATQNGSELLRERIDGGYNWQSMAHVEYARSVLARIPDGDQYDIERAANWDIAERNNPGLSEIKALKAVRPFVLQDGPGIRAAELSWCKIEAQSEDDETQKFPAISVMIVCPDAEKIWAHRRLSTQE